MSGLAFDWSKCYDRLPLAVLETLARAANLPQALWRPMLAAYALPRRVRAGGVAGPECDPSCGLAPGCPAATDWLALLVFCWKHQIQEVAKSDEAQSQLADSEGRDYVDDMVASSRIPAPADQQAAGAAVAVAAHLVRVYWLLTLAFRNATSLLLNVLKCVRFSTDQRVRDALAQMEGPPVAQSFMDLGVPQLATGRAAPALADKREAAVHPRLTRTACLALPLS